MAKADDPTSTLWLREALELAVAAFGSVAVAKAQLTEWLADGKLSWSCTSWKGLDAEGLAEKRRQKLDAEALVEKKREQGEIVGSWIYSLPSATYCPGDPSFWRAKLRIDWEDNAAYEARHHGAKALGIWVLRTDLLALLPEGPGERVEVLGQAKPAKRKLIEPKAWLAKIRKEHRRQQNELVFNYARRLHVLMSKAEVTKVWSVDTLRRRLYD